ncbi:hypothetical protein TVAG_029350 [Trichomonas vaginalis G3]|uniref:FHA domain-containing protein n=1 Tax=Trichomonas vaginalis (strain ATCC PRA-98 / G3) TaxID=412133 RepID=A2F527_TRIV3|nr:G-quadruplex RNA binding [Trichomonas vaginalis G3]EAY00031.1 hypothetical protein TVAG_029350 [Trichomonas vaginalis G3]KAI5523532.1 G-quadruplex RNA binding [Trichomonas vaginalis G3]|eukprot:XP_001312960.1 hypothetical protein [Trichomonas vaginalis G3]
MTKGKTKIQGPHLPVTELTREQITPPDDIIPTKPIDEETKIKILLGMLVGNPECIQLSVNGLEKYTKQEIFNEYAKILQNSTQNVRKYDIQPETVEFSTEEDFEILNYSKNHDEITNLQDFFSKTPSIYPFHSIKEICERFSYIKSLSQDEKHQIYQKMAKIILSEKITAESYEHSGNRGASISEYIDDYYKINDFSNLDSEISSISESALCFINLVFQKHELAILRTETLQFGLTKSRTLIGRSSKDEHVDIDMAIFGVNASLISRYQAVISLLEDLNFYLENIGTATVKVNGITIPTGSVCQLIDGCIIDSNDNLMIFYSNRNLLETIEKEYSKRVIKKSKSKSK